MDEMQRPAPKMNLRTSEQTERLYRAIVKFQGICPVVTTNQNADIRLRDNKPGFKYDYADLAQILHQTREARNQADLGVIFAPSVGGPVTCKIIHGESGQWMEADLLTTSTVSDARSIGSAITYTKRYLVVALLGIPVGDDVDDDGAAASNDGGGKKRKTYGQQQQPEPPLPPKQPSIKYEITPEMELFLNNATTSAEVVDFFNDLEPGQRTDNAIRALIQKHGERTRALEKKGAKS